LLTPVLTSDLHMHKAYAQQCCMHAHAARVLDRLEPQLSSIKLKSFLVQRREADDMV